LCVALIAPVNAFAGQPSSTASAPAARAGSVQGDFLYVGDPGDNTIKRYDAQTGAYLGVFVPTTDGSVVLDGPNGVLLAGNLLVANQNLGLPINGEIDQYCSVNGSSLGALVPSSTPNAPFAPDGIILGPDKRTLYVADLGPDYPGGLRGAVHTYDVQTGAFLGDLDFGSFLDSFTSNPSLDPTGEFRPRGLVFGPDGRLYISLFSEASFPAHGWLVRYDFGPHPGASLLASYTGSRCSQYLNAPDGLAFGPDGRLYVTARGAAASETDKILIFDIGGTCVDDINLESDLRLGRTRAQGLVFGPGGYLFLPMKGNGPDAGAVRRYEVQEKPYTYTDFTAVQSGTFFSYLTFGHTNPTTLAYSG
jgi:hypothetical protein